MTGRTVVAGADGLTILTKPFGWYGAGLNMQPYSTVPTSHNAATRRTALRSGLLFFPKMRLYSPTSYLPYTFCYERTARGDADNARGPFYTLRTSANLTTIPCPCGPSRGLPACAAAYSPDVY